MKHHNDRISSVSQARKDINNLSQRLHKQRLFTLSLAKIKTQTPLTINNCRIYFLILSFFHCKTVLSLKRQKSEMHFHSEKHAFSKILLPVISF